MLLDQCKGDFLLHAAETGLNLGEIGIGNKGMPRTTEAYPYHSDKGPLPIIELLLHLLSSCKNTEGQSRGYQAPDIYK